MAEIRLAQQSDVSRISGLLEALGREVPDLAVARLDLADESLLAVVAEESSELVGCLVGRFVGSSSEASRVVLDSVFVSPEHRGQGIGFALVWRLSDWAIELKCPEARAHAPTSAPRAQEFLQQCGFNVRSVGRIQIVEEGLERNNVHDEQPWFSVRCHFALEDTGSFDYEERITLWRAETAERAIQLAENEARSHAEFHGYRYLNACTSYHLADTGFAIEGKEVYSQMRESGLEPDAYLDRFFFTGNENNSGIGHSE